MSNAILSCSTEVQKTLYESLDGIRFALRAHTHNKYMSRNSWHAEHISVYLRSGISQINQHNVELPETCTTESTHTMTCLKLRKTEAKNTNIASTNKAA